MWLPRGGGLGGDAPWLAEEGMDPIQLSTARGVKLAELAWGASPI